MFDRFTARIQSANRPVDNAPFWEESSLELQHGLTVSEISCEEFKAEHLESALPQHTANPCATGH